MPPPDPLPQAAVDAMRRARDSGPHGAIGGVAYSDEEIVRLAEAAAPHIAAAERERIALLAERHRVKYGAYVAINGKQTSGLRQFADLIRTEGNLP
jgi:hypothetical protein